jgi:hypothetical protein
MNESTHNIETADPGDPAPSGNTAADAIADGVRHGLDPRSIPLQRVVGRIVTACVSLPLAAGIAVAWAAGGPPPAVVAAIVSGWAVITGVLGWWLHRWAALHHRYASYTVNAEDIEIRSGVVWRKAISVPRSRVQHTDVSQGPLERRYGLGTLGIYTAGTDHAKVSLDGLEHETALRIRDHLLPPAGADAV